jgi:hypothetical protein
MPSVSKVKHPLQDLITLKELKMSKIKNKKVVSSCIFIPELPRITNKTFNYFTSAIKSIETFHTNLKKKDRWVYRLYVDDLFFNDIKFYEKKQKTKVKTNSSKNKLTKRLNVVNSKYNSISNNEKLGVNANKSYRSKVKKAISKNKDNLKKIQGLMHIYLKDIISSKRDEYSHIEIISFNCDKIKRTGKYPGHSETFGSIMRFFPLFDKNVELFVSVNSSYPINPMMTMLLNDWCRKKDKKILACRYNCTFMDKICKSSFHEPLSEIRQGFTEGNNKLFIEVINDIFEMKEQICKNGSKISINESNLDKFEPKHKKGFCGSDSIWNHLISAFPTKYNTFNDSIAAGFFGMKKDSDLFKKRIANFIKLLRFYILTKNDFSYGIDELLLKITLAFEAGTMNMQLVDADDGSIKTEVYCRVDELNKTTDLPYIIIDNIDYYYFIELESLFEHILSPTRLLFPDFIGVRNSLNIPLTLPKELNDDNLILNDGDLSTINTYQSRSLLQTNNKDKNKLEQKEIIKVYYDSPKDNLEGITLNMGMLLSDYSEFKRLYIYDSKEKTDLKRLFNNYSEYFTIIDINDYELNIYALKQLIINIKSQYRNDNLIYELVNINH